MEWGKREEGYYLENDAVEYVSKLLVFGESTGQAEIGLFFLLRWLGLGFWLF